MATPRWDWTPKPGRRPIMLGYSRKRTGLTAAEREAASRQRQAAAKEKEKTR